MTGRSPIVLESSPHFRAPSITPQTRRSTSSAPESSSPGLPSLQSLLRPTGAGIKSGSRAQGIPQGAATGFTSAAGLWKSGGLLEAESGAKDSRATTNDVSGKASSVKKSTGKLTKPKKARARSPEAADNSRGGLSPLQDFAYRDGDSRRESLGSLPAIGSPLARELCRSEVSEGLKKRTSLSEYDFIADVEEHPLPRAKATKKAGQPRGSKSKGSETGDGTKPKKPRKRATKAEEKTDNDLVKKSKKRFAKSQSIILNSDEPDDAAASELQGEMKALLTADINSYAHVEPKKGFDTIVTSIASRPPVAHSRNTPTAETSAYFGEVEGLRRRPVEPDDNSEPSTKSKPKPMDTINESAAPLIPQPPRQGVSALPMIGADASLDQTALSDEDTPLRSLTNVLTGFGYTDQGPRPAPLRRTESGEALTKRRRIELTDAATVRPAMPRAPDEPTVQPPKKTKAAKKKPQTITDLATKAYRPPAEGSLPPPQLADFFAPQRTAAEQDTSVEIIKPKKPRKPRAKKTDADGGAGPSKATKSAQTKKAKAKINEAAYVAKLYSPEAARTAEQGQAFLFGTSSQLQAEESPSFIREMQTALLESEYGCESEALTGSQTKSRTKVPSALDGTNLSVGQGDRDLWCTAARDKDGHTLEYHRMRPERQVAAKVDPVAPFAPESAVSEGEPGLQEAISRRSPSPQTEAQRHENRKLVDLCGTSPTAPAPVVFEPQDKSPLSPEPLTCIPSVQAATEATTTAAHPPSDDSWMMLRSDSPVGNQIDKRQELLPTLSPRPYVSLPRAATSPGLLRTALADLDANVGITAQTSPVKANGIGQRSYATKSAPEEPKRRRGRPRKGSNASAAASKSPKRRGRPPKAAPTNDDAIHGASRPHPAKLQTSASQPTIASEFVNIDEISDSESPTTPSPPRRRATSSPPAMQPLDLMAIASPCTNAKVLTAGASTLKPSDTNWPSIQNKLFPQITAAVKSTPPSNDMNQPTWHEKILIYDPIVLEDFTAWLNGQNLRVEMQRLKPKAKAKGRKKKGEVSEEPEYETVSEELKSWMVQKWCEEKSICCLWKEGLRGGVRTRY